MGLLKCPLLPDPLKNEKRNTWQVEMHHNFEVWGVLTSIVAAVDVFTFSADQSTVNLTCCDPPSAARPATIPTDHILKQRVFVSFSCSGTGTFGPSGEKIGHGKGTVDLFVGRHAAVASVLVC